VSEALKWAEFAMLAEGHRRAGLVDQAEQLARTGIDEHPDSPEGAIVLALALLDQDRTDEARRVIEGWADTNLGVEVTDDSTSDANFGDEVSDGELETAFASAETDRDEVIDADAIAQQAMLDAKIDPAEEFTSPDSSFATRTVADLLSQQGDEDGASRIRAMVDSTAGDSVVTAGDPKAKKIERLERWLGNIQGGMQ
jgi:hypothetical protein